MGRISGSPAAGRAPARLVALAGAAVAANIALGQLAATLKLPLYLDSIGTVVVAIAAGPWAGALTGLVTNVIWGSLMDPKTIPFGAVAFTIGLVSGHMARAGWFRTAASTTASGALLGLVAAVVATPIVTYLFGGVTGSGSTFITLYLVATGKQLLAAVFTSAVLTDLGDKVITVLVARAVAARLPGTARADT